MTQPRIQFAGALAILALAGVLSGADGYLVSGVVVDSRSHTPIANARVSLASTTARDQKLELVTKQDGRFAFRVASAGKYTLQMLKPGYPAQAYKQSSFTGVASAIVVRDDQDTRAVVFEAARGSVITGQIKDDNSEPVGRALVFVFQSLVTDGERKVTLRAQTRANALGEFRVPNLRRGNYYVCAMGRPWFADSIIQLQTIQDARKQLPRPPVQAVQDAGQTEPVDNPAAESPAFSYSPDPGLHGTAFQTTCFPRAQGIEDASLVRVDAGSEAQVAIVLPFAKAASIRGTLSVPEEAAGGRLMLVKRVHDQYMLFLDAWLNKDHSFKFENVPAGSYQITGSSAANSGVSSWSVLEDVEVGSADMDVTLRPTRLASMSGHVVFDGERPASFANIFVLLRGDKGNLRVELGPEGAFALNRLPPGHYEVTAGSAQFAAAFLTYPSGERLPLTLDIGSGESVQRNVTLTRAVSVIEGTAEKSGAPQAGAFVLLMPKDTAQRWAYRRDQSDSDGSYKLASIPAGDYLQVALSDGEGVAYRDPKVTAILAKVAKPIHIEPGDHLDVKIDVISTASLGVPLL